MLIMRRLAAPRYALVSWASLAAAILAAPTIVRAQGDHTLGVYGGASLSVAITPGEGIFSGWGFEAGVKYLDFYLGTEAGRCRNAPSPPAYGVDFPNGYVSVGDDYDFESFYGAHLGYFVNARWAFGLVVIASNRWRTHYQGVNNNQEYIYTRFHDTWLNVGPDVRLQTSTHIMLSGAFTLRRGLKVGLDYCL